MLNAASASVYFMGNLDLVLSTIVASQGSKFEVELSRVLDEVDGSVGSRR